MNGSSAAAAAGGDGAESGEAEQSRGGQRNDGDRDVPIDAEPVDAETPDVGVVVGRDARLADEVLMDNGAESERAGGEIAVSACT